jgi:hypothetical protein
VESGASQAGEWGISFTAISSVDEAARIELMVGVPGVLEVARGGPASDAGAVDDE